ncbi:type IV secretion system protein [Aeriscardovia aeriphila]|uniref:TrbL/VirB6 plasmid conjugal transfer protein n=1 Tax=Aeriscardovia aeriphila TaxID=218139 RepID=A0A261FBJ6_9BIFI|nr:type IV secretion system protein [Aeriscardovia aeriphila]NYI25316.1 hypothetical protein [Aeriscardovia aeriphila]OZG56530.1 hypothetical protein AEAE_1018 [Aeriscardovia aeriphila]
MIPIAGNDDLKGMAHMIFQGVDTDTTDLLKSTPLNFGGDSRLWDTMGTLSTAMVLPIAAALAVIIFALQLSKVASRFEAQGDALLGLIMSTAVKLGICLLLVLNARSVLKLISNVGQWMFSKGSNAKEQILTHGKNTNTSLAEAILLKGIENVSGWDGVKKIKIFVLLLIPFLVCVVVQIVIRVMVTVLMFKLLIMSLFAPLPFAFFASDETKQWGYSYLKSYAASTLRLVALWVSVFVYQQWLRGEHFFVQKITLRQYYANDPKAQVLGFLSWIGGLAAKTFSWFEGIRGNFGGAVVLSKSGDKLLQFDAVKALHQGVTDEQLKQLIELPPDKNMDPIAFLMQFYPALLLAAAVLAVLVWSSQEISKSIIGAA